MVAIRMDGLASSIGASMKRKDEGGGGNAASCLFLGVGNPYFPPGRTQVELRGDGGLTMQTFTAEGVREDATTMDPSEAAALVACARKTLESLGAFQPSRREDDEPLYRIEVRCPGGSVLGVMATRRQVERCEALRHLREELASACSRSSASCHVL